ncbi:MAG: hypothetical protein RJA98_703 [Pseudomonadota bacterium]
MPDRPPVPAGAPPASTLSARPLTPRWRLAGLRLRVRVALALGFMAAAGRDLDAVLWLSPTDAWALASRSHWHGSQGAWPQALADAEALVAAHPQRQAADWFNLGFAREACGRIAPAEAAFRHALRMQPTLAIAWLGMARVQAWQGHSDDALATLAHHAQLQPWAPDGRVAQVTLLMQLQRVAEAQRGWDALRSFEPGAAWALLQQWPALAGPIASATFEGEHAASIHEGESASPPAASAAMMQNPGRGRR